MNINDISIFRVSPVTPIHKPKNQTSKDANQCGFKYWIACDKNCKYYDTCTRRKKIGGYGNEESKN